MLAEIANSILLFGFFDMPPPGARFVKGPTVPACRRHKAGASAWLYGVPWVLEEVLELRWESASERIQFPWELTINPVEEAHQMPADGNMSFFSLHKTKLAYLCNPRTIASPPFNMTGNRASELTVDPPALVHKDFTESFCERSRTSRMKFSSFVAGILTPNLDKPLILDVAAQHSGKN
ncbi:hypothetical protein BDZ97DRAFT_1761573 [Flammula alnicola]|nr:hypothetical protein BDZ97DRAFT_1761573 [Flammula alnicola]